MKNTKNLIPHKHLSLSPHQRWTCRHKLCQKWYLVAHHCCQTPAAQCRHISQWSGQFVNRSASHSVNQPTNQPTNYSNSQSSTSQTPKNKTNNNIEQIAKNFTPFCQKTSQITWQKKFKINHQQHITFKKTCDVAKPRILSKPASVVSCCQIH